MAGQIRHLLRKEFSIPIVVGVQKREVLPVRRKDAGVAGHTGSVNDCWRTESNASAM